MMLPCMLRVQENNILPKWYEETTRRLCFDCLEDRDMHIPSQPTSIHFYLWVKVPGQTLCTYANGQPCLFRLAIPLFTLQLKLLHPCVSFWEINHKNELQQVLCLFNLMKRKTLAKQTDSFKMKFDKKIYIKIYLYFNILLAVLEVNNSVCLMF